MALRNDGNEAAKIPLSVYALALQTSTSLGIFSRMNEHQSAFFTSLAFCFFLKQGKKRKMRITMIGVA